MTPKDYLIKNKLSLLQLANELKNIRKACKTFNVSRQHYYDLKRNYEMFGKDGLEPKVRKSPLMPNKTDEVIEKRIIDFTLNNPGFGKDRVASELMMHGLPITTSTIQNVWRRYKLQTRKLRFKKLEEKMLKDGFLLNDEQIKALALNVNHVKEHHVISYFPGYLLSQDTFLVGHIKGVGQIYMQAVVDTFGSFGFAKLYNQKTAITAAHMLTDCVLPFYAQNNLTVRNILTDNGTEYCGNEDHEFQVLLNYLDIKHRRAPVGHPQTNGFVERFNRTVLEEFFMKAFRQKWYLSIDELQKDLDAYLFYYNYKRTHQGYRVKGKRPIDIIKEHKNNIKLLTAN